MADFTVCSYCGVPEIAPGSHKPLSVEPATTWWRKIHLGHPNFVVEDVIEAPKKPKKR